MDITELEEYFPEVNRIVECKPYKFTIVLQNSNENEFVINLKIKQTDTKINSHIKFKFGIGKDKETDFNQDYVVHIHTEYKSTKKLLLR